MTCKPILVTGGAGYIGSHVVNLLGRAEEDVVVLDNLSTGFAEAVLHGKLIVGDTGDGPLVRRIISEFGVDTVMHFAAHTVVPESVRDPLKYYRNNTSNSRALLEACVDTNVRNFVFSSTAAVYGMPSDGFATEATPTSTINPYGTSKLMTEWMLQDVAAASSLRFAALRYFNVAGAEPTGRLGQSTEAATHLIKAASQAAIGVRDSITIFGTDYPTPDGTGIRDYIHVQDLAEAHLKALEYLRTGGESTVLNCGYGHGYSVREVLRKVEEVNGAPLAIVEAERRPGDPPALIAGVEKIRHTLQWKPRYDDLETIVRTALEWERKLHGTAKPQARVRL